MKALIRLIGVLVLVAIFLLSNSTLVSASEDWAVYMTVTTDPDIGSVPGESSHFGFGAKDGASDGYDSGEGDEIAPPDPIAGINAYFYYPANPPFQKNLIMSVTGPAESITWPLVVKMVGETGDTEMTISWPDIGSVPASYTVLELQDTGNTTLADMRSVDHYTFSASQGQTYNFQIRAEAEEIPEYDLTISSTAGGNVTTPGEGTFPYDEGTVVDLMAEAEEGYRFVNWTGDVSSIANVNGATTTITMNGDYEITANFEQIPPGQFSLTVSSTSGGSVTVPGEVTFTYDEGTVVNLVATPNAGYQFDKWTGDVITIANVNGATTTITMNGDYSIVANFEEVPSSPVGCFIATAAYVTPMAEEIEILREFRDEYLVTNPLGRNFVDFYYTVSPPIAEFITEHPGLKPIVRAGLVPAVAMSTVAVNTTTVEKMAIVGLLVLVSVAVAIWVMRRCHRDPEYA
jgi:aspartate 1-decarboxylase